MRMPSSLLTAASAAAVLCAMASLGGVVEVAHGFAPPSPSSSSLSRAKTTATSPPAAVPRGTTVAVETLRRRQHRRDATAATAATAANTRLFMGWGPEPIWSLGTVTRNFPACPSGSCVSLFLDVEDGSGFVNPGQYVQVRPAGGESSSSPSVSFSSYSSAMMMMMMGVRREFVFRWSSSSLVDGWNMPFPFFDPRLNTALVSSFLSAPPPPLPHKRQIVISRLNAPPLESIETKQTR